MIVTGIAGAAIGAAIGWIVSKNASRFTGGACPIMCNPKLSIPYFAFLGLILGLEVIK
jgi:hypothetical protein